MYWYDGPDLLELLARLYRYVKQDVALAREIFCRLPQLAPDEQRVWQHDAVVNERGFYADVELATAAQRMAQHRQAAINAELAALTGGVITTAHQVARIKAFSEQHGHALAGLTKRAVADALAHDPDDTVRRLLELRQEGSVAAVAKYHALLASMDADRRMRGTLKYHGSAPGRWSGRLFQPQNLRKPGEIKLDGAVDAVLAGDLERVRELGAPMIVLGAVSRCAVMAPAAHLLMGADFHAIESRILAWVSGEEWKLENYREFDRTGDPALEPYCVTASRLLEREVTPEDEAGRSIGKTADLGLGFGGGVGAWRRFDLKDDRNDAEIQENVDTWRSAHPNIVRFWRAFEGDLIRAIVTGQRIDYGDRLHIVMERGNLYVALPSGRRIAYPEARLLPSPFEGGRPQIAFKDNARGGWQDDPGMARSSKISSKRPRVICWRAPCCASRNTDFWSVFTSTMSLSSRSPRKTSTAATSSCGWSPSCRRGPWGYRSPPKRGCASGMRRPRPPRRRSSGRPLRRRNRYFGGKT